MTAPALDPGGIDAFAATESGVYRDALVEVRAQGGTVPGRRRRQMVRTASFDVEHVGSRVQVVHRVAPDEVDDDLAGRLASELFGPGWLRGSELFERLFVGIVLTCAPGPIRAWEAFYRQTLARVDDALSAPEPAVVTETSHGAIADYAPVYGQVESLLDDGSVLELGCCFGFLSLRLARAGHAVVASDLNGGSVALLDVMAQRLGLPLTTWVADAAAVPAPDRVADHVLAIHLLEHVDAETGDQILTEALRLARRRVVVAVPLELEADQTWGHVRTISLADLDRWGRGTGCAYAVHEFHGGWLVLDVA